MDDLEGWGHNNNESSSALFVFKDTTTVAVPVKNFAESVIPGNPWNLLMNRFDCNNAIHLGIPTHILRSYFIIRRFNTNETHNGIHIYNDRVVFTNNAALVEISIPPLGLNKYERYTLSHEMVKALYSKDTSLKMLRSTSGFLVVIGNTAIVAIPPKRTEFQLITTQGREKHLANFGYKPLWDLVKSFNKVKKQLTSTTVKHQITLNTPVLLCDLTENKKGVMDVIKSNDKAHKHSINAQQDKAIYSYAAHNIEAGLAALIPYVKKDNAQVKINRTFFLGSTPDQNHNILYLRRDNIKVTIMCVVSHE